MLSVQELPVFVPLVQQELASVAGQLYKLRDQQNSRVRQQGESLTPEQLKTRVAELTSEEARLRSLHQKLSARSAQYGGYDPRFALHGGYDPFSYRKQPARKTTPNPLEKVQVLLQTDATGNAEKLRCLSRMCEELAIIFEDDSEKKSSMQRQLEQKMTSLKAFAVALNRVPEVLNQYVLVRLGEINVKDLSVLKPWISHQEATRAHRMLEAFRDEAIYERAVRECASNTSGSWEEIASGKRYLFANSVEQAAEDELSPEEGDEHDQHVGSDTAREIGSPAKHKRSHRQRNRQAKFWASVPRTPSSTTHQS